MREMILIFLILSIAGWLWLPEFRLPFTFMAGFFAGMLVMDVVKE